MREKKFMKLLGVIVLCLAMITTTPISVFAEDILQTDDVQQVQKTTQEDINQDESNNNQGESGTAQNEGEQDVTQESEAEITESDLNSSIENDTENNDESVMPAEEVADVLNIKYSAYLQGTNWQEEKSNGETAGTVGQNRAMKALKVQLENNTGIVGTVQYCAHVSNIGWQNYVEQNELAGTTETGLQIEAIRMKLTGELAEQYDIYYRVHATNVGWLSWVKNDEKAGTVGYAYSVQAVEIKVCKKNSAEEPITDGKGFMSEETVGKIMYQTHVQNIGWQNKVYDGTTAGTVGRNLNLEALKLKVTEAGRANLTGSITCEAHVQDIGWQSPVSDWQEAGTTGKNKKIEAIKINLTEQLAATYDVYYRVHSANYGWLGWAKNGEEAGTKGLNLGAQAIEVKLYEKGSLEVPAQTERSCVSLENLGSVLYRTHVQNIGWQSNNFYDGQTAGTTGKNYSIEAITIKVTELGKQGNLTGSILYEAHVQDIGWQKEVADGQTAGTTGKNKKIEAIKIRLSEQLEAQYDIYYRVHSARFGWLDWTKNGEVAGTVGYNAGVEAIEIKLYGKGDVSAPACSGRSYLSADQIGKLTFQTSTDGSNWQAVKQNGEITGTTGTNTAIRQLSMNIASSMGGGYTGNVEYRLHLSNVGWQDWKTNGEVSGDGINQAEAVQIRLTGELEKYADIYYRTHVSNYGWLGWAKNGQAAGTTKCSYKLQAIQIKIVPKGTAAPGSNSNYYKDTQYIRMLARFSTVSTNDANGFYNMSRALSSFNGVVVNPGQTLSFFGVAGPCGQAQGYRPGGVVGGIGYGGGICQASTTLYGGAIRAGMTIIERNNHTIASTYVPRGLDAMVSYGDSDLKFRNDLGFPVTIKTYTVGNTLYVEFYGQDPGWFDFIEPVSWSSGHSAWAKRKYYKNGSVIRTENLPSSYYYN